MTEEVKSEVSETEEVETLASKDSQSDKCILQYTISSMGIGIIPIPLIDLVALTAVQLKMLHNLSKIYDVEFKAHLGKSAISSLVGGAVPVATAAPFAASLSKFIPVIGHTISYSSLIILNGASTYAIGQVFEQHFASGGTFLNFKPEEVRDYFVEQYEKGKKIVSSLHKKKQAPEEATTTATE